MINNIMGYHYTNQVIDPHSVITSLQSKALNYERVWRLYKQVADKLGLYFPTSYGYAYFAARKNSLKFQHMVSAPETKVTFGNLNYSLYVTLDQMSQWRDKSLPLDKRAQAVDLKIINNANRYFGDIANLAHIELISDVWDILKTKTF